MELYNLYQSLKKRKRPEDVAQMILELMGNQLGSKGKNILQKAAKGSLKRRWLNYTSMHQDFFKPVGAQKQIDKAIELFKLKDINTIDGDDPEAIEQFIKRVSVQIHKNFGKNHFIQDRLNREARLAFDLDISKRRYNKLFRHIKRLEKKLEILSFENQKSEFQHISKHGIVHRLEYEDFVKDAWSACFVAYYTAKCNLRSEFTIKSQKRPFDQIAQFLLDKATESQNANYLAIAYVYPDVKILAELSQSQKGQLLGVWTKVLGEIAELLARLWKDNNINRSTMIVKRGNDSSTWNHTAGAWNKARDAWINLNYALGTEFVLDTMCFGKVMRLMAADLVYWHHQVGNKLDPNTVVWQKIPLPWKVFNGEASCNRQMVIKACQKAGLNPEKSGWIAPRPQSVVAFEPTPELVHGVSISNPFLAKVLKKHKYFSGKKAQPIQSKYN